MPLLDYISGDEDSQRSEIEEFLSERWDNVMDEEPVTKAQETTDTHRWYMQGFSVLNHKVEGNDRIEVGFSFKANGLDENEKQTGETLEGTARAWIDDFDNVEFSDVEAELTNPSCQQIGEELFFPDSEEEPTTPRSVADEAACLINDTKTLLDVVNSHAPEAQESLTSDRPLPPGCPSKVDLALDPLRVIEGHLDELVATVKRLKESIRHEG